jgi:hypothetical protein
VATDAAPLLTVKTTLRAEVGRESVHADRVDQGGEDVETHGRDVLNEMMCSFDPPLRGVPDANDDWTVTTPCSGKPLPPLPLSEHPISSALAHTVGVARRASSKNHGQNTAFSAASSIAGRVVVVLVLALDAETFSTPSPSTGDCSYSSDARTMRPRTT